MANIFIKTIKHVLHRYYTLHKIYKYCTLYCNGNSIAIPKYKLYSIIMFYNYIINNNIYII